MAGARKRRRGAAETSPETVREVAPAFPERPVRKNHYLYQSKLDRAKEILGVATETEALDAALDLLIYGEELARGTEQMEGEAYLDVLGIAGEVPGGGAGP